MLFPIKGIEHAGRALNKRRKTVGMTQAELARLSNVSQSSISDIETGHVTPSLETYLRLLNCLEAELHICKKIETRPC